jgi:hypothetical protein
MADVRAGLSVKRAQRLRASRGSPECFVMESLVAGLAESPDSR